jgi:hypothetical protein
MGLQWVRAYASNTVRIVRSYDVERAGELK